MTLSSPLGRGEEDIAHGEYCLLHYFVRMPRGDTT